MARIRNRYQEFLKLTENEIYERLMGFINKHGFGLSQEAYKDIWKLRCDILYNR